MKTKIKKKCKHLKWKHITIKGENMNAKDKNEYLWLTHKCLSCGIETCSGLIEDG